MNIVIIGGGAAGFFSALAAKKANPQARVLLLERSAKLLSKVALSGGGRCNVTHACFDPKELVRNYPRGQKELLGPFHRFQPQDTINWFKKRGVKIKKEEDGRCFPITDSSQTIIDCFLGEAKKLGVDIWMQTKLKKIEKGFTLDIGKPLIADRLILATGSSKGGWEFAKELGHTIQPPVPSLFTFNIPHFPLVDLAGISVTAKLKLMGTKLESLGPLLITHWGFSGPAALKLSAFGARFLAEKDYSVSLKVDWLPEHSESYLMEQVEREPSRQLGSLNILPKNLWKTLCIRSKLSPETPIRLLSRASLARLCQTLKHDVFEVRGKTTNKEEFVTCGGVTLSEVNFQTMESKRCNNLFFCGEILDIDGITGGFNFQNAWTTGWIAGQSAAGGNPEVNS